MSNSLADPRNILAGSKAAGTRGTSLVWARNVGDGPADTEPNTAEKAFENLDDSYIDMGQCDTKGTSLKQNVSTNPIKSFGSLAPQGNLYTDYTGTAEVTFQETTPNTFAIYRSLPLGSVSVLETADGGVFGGGVGLPVDCRYQTVFDGFSQHGDAMRFYLPNSANTEPGDLNMQMGEVMDRPITLTMYPDEKGNLFYEWYMLKNLLSATGGSGATLTVSPASKTLSLAGVKTQQITATLDGTDVSASATYVSGTPAVATVSSSGLVTGVSAGTSVITVTKSGVSATVNITVTA